MSQPLRRGFMQYLRDSFEQAVFALQDNRLRTFLSIVGVAVGIAAVITVDMVARSGREAIYTEFETYGLNSIWVYRLWEEENPFYAVRQGSGITNDDLEALKTSDCCPAIKRISPKVYHQNWMQLVNVGNNYARVGIDGVDAQFLSIDNSAVETGRGFREEDIRQRKPVAILGNKAREELFGAHSDPVGRALRFGDLRLTVIGVLENKDRQFLIQSGRESKDENNRILIPYTLYQQMFGAKEIHTLQAEAVDAESVAQGREQIVNFLTRRHNYKYKYTSEDMKPWIDEANEKLGIVTLIGLLGASISLLVGGLGIMNIMTTSVMERTREIGIRKAIGARNKDIQVQFLIESVVISAFGGLIGFVLGIAAGFLIVRFTGLPLAPSVLMIVVALLVASAVGLTSGYYPARRAAQLRPVDALRYE
jgi:ABC-type antimicrobial peptide transport system permease subunit